MNCVLCLKVSLLVSKHLDELVFVLDDISINDIIRNLPVHSKQHRRPVHLTASAQQFLSATSLSPYKNFRIIEKSVDDDVEFDDDTIKLPPQGVFSLGHDGGSLRRRKSIVNHEKYEDDTLRKVPSCSCNQSSRRRRKSTVDDEEYEDDDQGDIDEDDDVVIEEENINSATSQEYDKEDEEENRKNLNSQVKHINDTILEDVPKNESVVNGGYKIIRFAVTKILFFDLILLCL